MVKGLKPSQQLVVGCICQGLILGPILFNVFFNNMDNGAECTFSRFVDDTKLGGVTYMLESSTAIQKDLSRLEIQDGEMVQERQMHHPAPGTE